MSRQGLLWLSLTVAISVACSAPLPTDHVSPSPTPPEVVRITLPSTGVQPGRTLLAQLAGTLSIDPETRCVYAIQAGGAEVNIWWPIGFNATIDPFLVYDSRGHVIARGGEPVVLAGGTTSEDIVAPPPGCRPRGKVWLVGAVGR